MSDNRQLPDDTDAPEPVRLVKVAREASAYAAGAARASWDSLIRAAEKTEEAASAWYATREAESISARLHDSDGVAAPEPGGAAPASSPGGDDPVSAAERTVADALPRESRRNLARLAAAAAKRSREAMEIAQFSGSMASQAASAWRDAEAAWLALSDSLEEVADD